LHFIKIFVDVVGWIGVVLYALAYYEVSRGKVQGKSRRYQYMNLAGAVGVAINAFYNHAYPSAIVNMIWMGIAMATLFSLVSPREERDPGRPDTLASEETRRLVIFISSITLMIIISIAVLLTNRQKYQPPQPIRVNTSNWVPYVDQSAPNMGPISEVVREVFRSAGYEPVIDFIGWKQATEEVKDLSALAAFPLILDSERRENFTYSDPLMEFRYVLFYRKDRFTSKELIAWARGELTDVDWKISYVEGYAVWPELQDLNVSGEFQNIQEAFEALQDGKIDLLVEGELVGKQALFNPKIRVNRRMIQSTADIPEEKGINGILTSKQSLRILFPKTPVGEQIRDKINMAIKRVDAFERLEKIRNRLGKPPVHLKVKTEARTLDGTTCMLAENDRAILHEWEAHPEDPPGQSEQKWSLIKMVTGTCRGDLVYVPRAVIEIDELEETL